MNRLVQNSRLVMRLVAVVAILVVANYGVSKMDVKWDMTKSGLYSLSEQSQEIARNVEDNVELIFFHSDAGRSRAPVKPLWVRTLLKQYAGLSDKISFSEINPNVSPSRAREYQIRQNNAVVVKVGQKHKKIAPFDIVQMRRRGQNTFKGESEVTGTLKNLTTATDRTIWMATGHGEVSPQATRNRSASSFKTSIQDEGFTVNSWDVLNDELPDKGDLLVILDPQSEYQPAQVERLKQWYENGGNLLIAGTPQHRSSINSIWTSFGISMSNRHIVGQNWEFYYRAIGDPFILSPSLQRHPTLKPLKDEGMSLMLGRSGPLTFDTDTIEPLIKTGSDAHAKPLNKSSERIDPRFNPQSDKRGPFTLAGVMEGSEETGKLVVLANSHVFTNQLIGEAGNQDFAINLVNWFLERDISIGIKPKPMSSNVVDMSPYQAYILQIVSLIGIPFAVLIWGVAVWWKRKNL